MDPNAYDLILLETLKQADPVISVASGGDSYVVTGSIPLEVLKAFEALTPSVRYVKVGPARCVPIGDWLSCRERLISKLMRRMTSRSFELGISVPTSDDLKNAPTLSPWIAIRDPEYGGAILVGMQTGHPTLRGPLISTSRLCGIDASRTWARTVSRWYRLNDPATADNLTERLGRKSAGLKARALEFSELQALIAEDLVREGLKDV